MTNDPVMRTFLFLLLNRSLDKSERGNTLLSLTFARFWNLISFQTGFVFWGGGFFWLLHSHSSLCQIIWRILSPGSLISASDHTVQRTDAALLINAALQTKVKWHQRCWKALMRNHWINLGNRFLCNLCSSLVVFVSCAQLFNFLFL